MKAKHAEKKTSITISLRLFIGIIVLFVLIIVAVTYYSVYRELNTGNNNSAAASVAATAAETNDISASESSQNTPQKETSEPVSAVTDTTQQAVTAEPATKASAASGSEIPSELTSFSGEMYPYKAFDNVGKRDASVKEVFGSVYGGEGITFDENGLFSDNITQSESNYGIYTVSDGTIKLSYSNDKTKTAEIISYKNNVPSEMKIDYVGYDVYFKIGSAE